MIWMNMELVAFYRDGYSRRLVGCLIAKKWAIWVGVAPNGASVPTRLALVSAQHFKGEVAEEAEKLKVQVASSSRRQLQRASKYSSASRNNTHCDNWY